MKANLIIFIKNPVLGKVKTRLAKDIGELRALRVYLDLLFKTKEETLQVNVNKYLYYSDYLVTDEWSSLPYIKKVQYGEDLGQRMQNAFKECFSDNLPTIIIGSDCYDLDHNKLEFAFSKLKENDIVIGPAIDGGYYLLGMNRYTPQLFEKINWSTSSVLSQTLDIANQLNLKVFKLEELIDLDTFEDLKKSTYQLAKKI